jgi:hypothetical protein
MKPKAKTMQERLGYVDGELSTPKHDEMLLWLDANSETIIADLFPTEWTPAEQHAKEQAVERARTLWVEQCNGLTTEQAKTVTRLKAEIDHWHRLGVTEKEHDFRNQLAQLLTTSGKHWPDPGPPPPRPAFKIESKKWEVPIKAGNYIIGYIDFLITGQKGRVYLTDSGPSPTWTVSRERARLLFEVKPSIPSRGELLRQINTYREYETNSQCFVVSSDDRFEQWLASQDIRFVKYTG